MFGFDGYGMGFGGFQIFQLLFFIAFFGIFLVFLIGDRLELRLPGREYGLLTEGDTGLLTFQGTRYLSFERQGTAVSYQAKTSERAENGNRGERRSWDPEL